MYKMRPTGHKVKAALDLGSSFAKMLTVSDDGNRVALTGFGVKRLTGESRDDKADAIRSLAAELRPAAKELAISVCGPSVQARFISIPKMKEAELAGAARFEAEKFMPFNIDDCLVGYHVLRKNERENRLDLILVAAKKDFVEEKIRAVEEAGFGVSLVDVDSFAVVNAFLKNPAAPKNDKTVALIDIGSSSSNLCILSGGNLRFVRTIGMAGNDFNGAISKALGVDAASAEGLKTNPGSRRDDVSGIIKGAANALIDEVKLSFGYYENQYGTAVDEIYLSGGSSAINGIVEILKEAFGSGPSAWDPTAFMDISGVDTKSLEEVKRYFAVAAGLALR